MMQAGGPAVKISVKLSLTYKSLFFIIYVIKTILI